ncbi:MAG: isochorismatase family cysteine hydrolase [Pseudomonadota bacterium]
MSSILEQFSTADRERAIDPGRTALLSIDMQNAEWSPQQHAKARVPGSKEAQKLAFLDRLETSVIPNQVRLQAAARKAGVEIIYTVIEALTRDGRDISLDHKISGLFFPKGSWEAGIIEAVAPVDDEIVIPKTASGIFNATNIEYVLRNLGITQLVIYGVCTDQCVENAVRDAADRGFLVTLVEDCCAAEEEARHLRAIEAMAGHYARMRSTDDLIRELEAAPLNA